MEPVIPRKIVVERVHAVLSPIIDIYGNLAEVDVLQLAVVSNLSIRKMAIL